MGKAWKAVITLAALLLVLGLVLVGAAWLTGASPLRIVELVFNGRTGLRSWWDASVQSALDLWDNAVRFVTGLF